MITPIPTLETERLRLRAWTLADVAPFTEMCGDAELMRYVGGVMLGPNAWRRMAAYAGHWQLRGYGPWALESKATGELAGYCGVNYPAGWPEPEISWGLRRAYLRQGLIMEAATAARGYAYDVLGFSSIMSFIDHNNAPSIAAAKRLGAVLDGEGTYLGTPMGIWRHIPPATLRAQNPTPKT